MLKYWIEVLKIHLYLFNNRYKSLTESDFDLIICL